LPGAQPTREERWIFKEHIRGDTGNFPRKNRGILFSYDISDAAAPPIPKGGGPGPGPSRATLGPRRFPGRPHPARDSFFVGPIEFARAFLFLGPPPPASPTAPSGSGLFADGLPAKQGPSWPGRPGHRAGISYESRNYGQGRGNHDSGLGQADAEFLRPAQRIQSSPPSIDLPSANPGGHDAGGPNSILVAKRQGGPTVPARPPCVAIIETPRFPQRARKFRDQRTRFSLVLGCLRDSWRRWAGF